MWPYTQEENEMLSTPKPKPEDNLHPMDWAEIYGHENYRRGIEK